MPLLPSSESRIENVELTDEGLSKVMDIYEELEDLSLEEEEEELEWNDFASSYGLTFLGKGTMRAVFLFEEVAGVDEAVAKISLSSHVYGNVYEVLNWNLVEEIDEEFTDRFAEVYDYDKYGRWVLMEFVSDRPNFNEAYRAENVFMDRGWFVTDYSHKNVGKVGGKVVMVDYGIDFEGVVDMPVLEETIYDNVPTEVKHFREGFLVSGEPTTLHREVERMISRVRENDISLEDIKEAQRKSDYFGEVESD